MNNREKMELKKNEQRFRNMWDYNKRTNILVVIGLKSAKRGWGLKSVKFKIKTKKLEDIMAKYPNLAEDINQQIKELSEPQTINLNTSPPAHIIVKRLKTKDNNNNKILKQQETNNSLQRVGKNNSDEISLLKLWRPKGSSTFFKCQKNYQSRFCIQ